MKKTLLILAAFASLSSFGVLRTYWSFTNTVNNLPDLEAGRIRFADGSSFDTNHGAGVPKFYDAFTLADNPVYTNTAPYKNLIGKPVFFANGRPVVIEPISGTAAKVRVSWGRYLPTSTYHYIDIPTNSYVFGGSDGARGTDGNFLNTSVTVANAKVRSVYGGNIANGVVANATISVTGDSADVRILYGSNYGFPYFDANTADNMVNRACVGKVTINVAGGHVTYLYGGGYSVSDVGACEINVTGGTVDELVPGPASGLAGSLKTTITGGYVGRLPAWSRGYVGTSTIEVHDGIVNNLYAGGDSTTFGMTASEVESAFGGSVYLDLTGGTVSNLVSGLNGGVVSLDMVKGVYTEGVVQKMNGGTFDPATFHLNYAVSHSFNSSLLFIDAGDGKKYRYVSTNGVLQATCLEPDAD